MNRPHFRRRPRPVDPEPYTRLDRLDGLGTRLTNIQVLGRDRYAQCDETCTADCGACKGRRFGPYALPPRTRYDAQWPDVFAAEWSSLPPVFAPHTFVGGDLPAMAAPWPGMARDELGTYAEPVAVELTAEQVDAIRVGDPTPPEHGLGMCTAGERFLCTLPEGHPGRQHVAGGAVFVVAVWPRGRHRQTDPLDLILADLRDIEDRLS